MSLILFCCQVPGEGAGGEEDKGGGRGRRGRTLTRRGRGSQYGAGAILTGTSIQLQAMLEDKRTFLVRYLIAIIWKFLLILFLRTSNE